MIRPHVHTEECEHRVPPCTRELDFVPDMSSVTGSLELRELHQELKARGRPPRQSDPKRWWTKIVLKAALKAIELTGVLAAIGLLALAKRCGVNVSGLTP